ncbi:MAG TPA: DUF4238 domain-containing protein [Thermoanaerobaculia bacterium]|jgi:hypothetical protein
MRKAPKTNAKRHHLIPESYMRRFASDGRRVHVFDRDQQDLRVDVPHNIAVEKEFNTIRTFEGEPDRSAEARLGEVDGGAASALSKILRKEVLSRQDRWSISFFFGFAFSRGRSFRKHVAAQIEAADLVDTDRPKGRFIDEQFATAFSAMTGLHLDARVIENMVLQDVHNLPMRRTIEIGAMVQYGFEIARYFFWAQWLVGSAPAGSEYVTSDRPVAFLLRNASIITDPFEPRAVRVLPISPELALYSMAAPEHSLSSAEVPAACVRLANAAFALSSDRYVIARSEAALRTVLADVNLATPDT